MIRSASEMRAAARASLSGKWGGAVMVTLVYLAVMGVLPAGIDLKVYDGVGSIIQLVLMPLGWSMSVLFLDNLRSGDEYKVGQLFEGFRDYTRVAGTMILTGIYTFLWTLLLIVPGIIKSFSYAMTAFVLRDNPELKFNGAIEKSMKMKDGHKFDLFYLYLTFIGWGLLCILTLGIGLLWFVPYMQSALAHFYEDVKAEYEAAQAQGE